MFKLLDEEVTRDGNIIYNSRTGPNVGVVVALRGYLPNVFARLFINKQDISLLAIKQIFVVPLEDSFLFKEEIYVSTNEPICICAFQFAPHKCQSMNDIL